MFVCEFGDVVGGEIVVGGGVGGIMEDGGGPHWNINFNVHYEKIMIISEIPINKRHYFSQVFRTLLCDHLFFHLGSRVMAMEIKITSWPWTICSYSLKVFLINNNEFASVKTTFLWLLLPEQGYFCSEWSGYLALKNL